MKSLLLVIATLVCLLKTVNAISIDIPAHSQHCFFEELAVGDKMTVTFQVHLALLLSLLLLLLLGILVVNNTNRTKTPIITVFIHITLYIIC